MRLSVVGGCALGFALGWNVTSVGAVAEPLADAYGVGLGVIGLVATAFFVTHVALQIPGGRASDRFGARRTGLVGLVVAAAGNGVALATPVLGLALGGRLVVGVGTGIGFVAGSAYVRAVGGSPFAQGLYGGVGLGGAGAALAVVPALESTLGWRAPFLSAAAVAVGALVLLLGCARDRAGGHAMGSSARRSVLLDRALVPLGVLYAASFGLSIVVGNWVVTLLKRNTDLSLEQAGLVGALTLALGVVTRPLGGWVMRAHPERTRAAVGASLALGAAGTLALTAAGPVILAALGAALIGIAAGIPFAPAFLGAAATRPDAPAAAIGYVNGVGNLAAVIGTPLLGIGFALPGDGRLGFLVVAALWLGALAVLPGERALGVGRLSPRGP